MLSIMLNTDNRPTSRRVHGIILAAGAASRMGKDKLLLPFRGLPLLQHVINAATDSHLEQVTLVLPSGDARRQAVALGRCSVINCPESRSGQAFSLKAGLNAVPQDVDGCMILLGDQPLITTSVINHLLDTFSHRPEHWIAPEQNGRRGNPVIIPEAWFTRVKGLQGDMGARPLLTSPEVKLYKVSTDEIGPFFDVDTPEQYKFLCDRYDTPCEI